MLDPQVQNHLIDIAWQIASETARRSFKSPSESIEQVIKLFDQAYKSLLKSITEQQTLI